MSLTGHFWKLPYQVIFENRTGNSLNPKRTLSEFGGWRKKIARPVRNFPKTKNWKAVSDFPRNVAISRTPRSGGAGGLLLVSKVLAHTGNSLITDLRLFLTVHVKMRLAGFIFILPPLPSRENEIQDFTTCQHTVGPKSHVIGFQKISVY